MEDDDEYRIPWTVRGRVDAMVARMSVDDARAIRDLRRTPRSNVDRSPRFHHHQLAAEVLAERPHLREPFTSGATGQGRILGVAASRVLRAAIDPEVWLVGIRRAHDPDDPLWPRYRAEMGVDDRPDLRPDLRSVAFGDDHHGWCTVWALFEATVDVADAQPPTP